MNKTKNEAHISKAQIEVWQMKDKIYESVKDLSIDKALITILENSKEITEKLISEKKLILH